MKKIQGRGAHGSNWGPNGWEPEAQPTQPGSLVDI